MFIPDRRPFGSRDVSAPCIEPDSLEQQHERNRVYAITTVMSLRDRGMKQFLDYKTFKPGLGAYRR